MSNGQQELIEKQIVYLKELKREYQNQILNKYGGDNSWMLQEISMHEGEKEDWSKCEYVKNNGEKCGQKIKWEYELSNGKGKSIIVGSTCVHKLLGMGEKTPTENNRIISELVNHERKLESQVMEIKKYEVSNLSKSRDFSIEEKEKIVEDARKLNTHLGCIQLFLDEGIELTYTQYQMLKLQNIEYQNRLREKEKLKREHERKAKERHERSIRSKYRNKENASFTSKQIKVNREYGSEKVFTDKQKFLIKQRVHDYVSRCKSNSLFKPKDILLGKFDVNKVPRDQIYPLKLIIESTLQGLEKEQIIYNIDGIASFNLAEYRKK